MDRVPAVALDDGLQPAGDVHGRLEFRDVWFQYHGRNKVGSRRAASRMLGRVCEVRAY